MNKYAQEFLTAEIEYFRKAAELQFNHFMQVFLFWTAVVTAPITAGLLVNQNNPTSNTPLSILLILVAVVGWFLAAKMYDIRCSQLTYISKTNYIREAQYVTIKNQLPQNYEHQYPANTNLRTTALRDFGSIMAFTMSMIHGVYLAFGVPMWKGQNIFDLKWFLCSSIFGIISYYVIIIIRGPKPLDTQFTIDATNQASLEGEG